MARKGDDDAYPHTREGQGLWNNSPDDLGEVELRGNWHQVPPYQDTMLSTNSPPDGMSQLGGVVTHSNQFINFPMNPLDRELSGSPDVEDDSLVANILMSMSRSLDDEPQSQGTGSQPTYKEPYTSCDGPAHQKAAQRLNPPPQQTESVVQNVRRPRQKKRSNVMDRQGAADSAQAVESAVESVQAAKRPRKVVPYTGKVTSENLGELFTSLGLSKSYQEAFNMLKAWKDKECVQAQVPNDCIRFLQHIHKCFPYYNQELVVYYHNLFTQKCRQCMEERLTTAEGTSITRKQMLVQNYPRQMCLHRSQGTKGHLTESHVKGKREKPKISVEDALKTFFSPNYEATCARINVENKVAQAVEIQAVEIQVLPVPAPEVAASEALP